MKKDIQHTIILIKSTFFDAFFFLIADQKLKYSSTTHAQQGSLHLKRHNLKDLQSTTHGKIQVILDLQSRSMGVKGLTQKINKIITTWQQSYGVAMVTTSGCLIKQKI